jgi:SAM-dependent methyltransferase
MSRGDAERRVAEVFAAGSREDLVDAYAGWAGRYDEDILSLDLRGPEIVAALAARHLHDRASPILDAGAGTGRIGALLAILGYGHLVALDLSAAMLARARERLARLDLNARLVEQDMRRLQLEGQRFRTILLVLDSFGLLLDRADQVRCLRAAKAHATHDARLVLDVSNGNLRGGGEPAEELVHHLTAESITKWVVRRTPPAEQLDELLCFYDELQDDGLVRRTMVELRLRWFTRFELELLLDKTGWEVDELYGGYGLEPYGPTSDRLIFVCR